MSSANSVYSQSSGYSSQYQASSASSAYYHDPEDLQYPQESTEHTGVPLSRLECLDEQLSNSGYSDCSMESSNIGFMATRITESDGEKSTQFKIAKEKAKVPFLYHHLLECDNNSAEYTIKDHDITLRIPEGAVPVGESINFEIGVAAYGPFIFPGSSRPISSMVWLCILEDIELKKPFQLILPHFLVGLDKERLNYHQVNFAKANHGNYNDVEKVYRFNHHDCEHLFASTKYRSYGVLSSTHCCFYCLLANNTPELTQDAGYCLARIENILSPRRNEVYFSAIFFLDSCIKV